MKLKNFFAVALAGLAFTACNNDDVPGAGTGAEEATTYIGLTIQLPKGSVTKAADTEATTAETKLTNLKVYCWKDGALGMGTPTPVDIAGGATDKGNNTYEVTAAIKASVGKNNLFVLANTSEDLTLSDVTTPNAIEKTLAALSTGTDGFIMYSDKITVLENVEQAKKTDVEAGSVAANQATVKLRRAVAKVSVTSALGDHSTGIADLANNGKIYDIKWSVVNQPTKLFPVIKMLNASGDFVASNVVSPYDAFETATAAIALPTSTDAASVYCKENVHGAEPYTGKNTTAVNVEGVFAPGAEKYISNVEAVEEGNYTITRGVADMNKGDDFYVLKTTDNNLTAGNFFNQAGADAYATLKTKTVAELFNAYTGGKCYWAIWINDGNAESPAYGVLRNHVYNMNIKSIAAPGYPNFPDEDAPIASDTWIQVSIDVEAWTSKDMGEQELK